MALAVFRSERKSLDRVRAESNAAVTRLQNARLRNALQFGAEPFAGLGDSQAAEQTLNALRGTAASAVRVIRNRIQGLELGVYVRRFIDGDFEDSPAFDHPLQMLLDNPTRDPATGNHTHTARQLWGLVQTQQEALGEAYLIILKDGSGIPFNLQIAQPGTIEPTIQSGRITGYRVTARGAPVLPLKPSDVVRFWSPDPFDLFNSSSVLVKAAVQVNMDLFVNQHWEKHYRFDATPKTVLENTDPTADFPNAETQELINTSWARKFQRRLGRAIGTLGWIKPGWKAVELNTQSEAQHGVTMMGHTSGQVLEAYGVPASMVGRVVDVNRAAAETNLFTFDRNAIEPRTLQNAEALTSQLASQYPQNVEGVQLIVKYKPFIARDKKFEIEKDDIDLKNFTRTINEVRQSREPSLPLVPYGDLPVGTIGQVPYTGEEEEAIDLAQFGITEETEDDLEEAATIDVDEAEEEIEDRPEEERQRQLVTRDQMRAHFTGEMEWKRTLRRDKRFTPKFRSRQSSVFSRQAEIVIDRYLKRERSQSARVGVDPAQTAAEIVNSIMPLKGWEDMFERVLAPVRSASYVASATEALDAITGASFIFTERSIAQLTAQNSLHYVYTNETTRKQLLHTLTRAINDGKSTDQTAREINRVFGKRKESAVRIAQTEMASASQAAQVEGFEQSGVVEGKQWNTSLDDLVRDSHLIEGQTRKLDQPFDVGGSPANGPADPGLPAGDRINCRCFVTPVFIEEDPLALIGGA